MKSSSGRNSGRYVGLVLILIGLLSIPMITHWVVQDFIQQTMHLSSHFESLSVDPIRGNLQIKGISFGPQGSDDELAQRSVNTAGRLWVKYSTPTLLYRRLYAPIVYAEGVSITPTQQTLGMMPNFSAGDQTSDLFLSFNARAKQVDQVIKRSLQTASFKKILDESSPRFLQSVDRYAEEIARLENQLTALVTTQLDNENPLRTALEANQLQTNLDRIKSRYQELQMAIDRESEMIDEAGHSSRECLQADWLKWSREGAEIGSPTAQPIKLVDAMMKEYSKSLMQPLQKSLVATHSIMNLDRTLEVSLGANSLGTGDIEKNSAKDVTLGLNHKPSPPAFTFSLAKLSGKVVHGDSSLEMNGTIKNKSTRLQGVPSLDRLQGDFTFREPSVAGQLSESNPIVAKSTIAKSTAAKSTDKNNIAQQPTGIQCNAASFSDQTIHLRYPKSRSALRSVVGSSAAFEWRATQPETELHWSLDGTDWECRIELRCSKMEIAMDASLQNGFAGLSSQRADWDMLASDSRKSSPFLIAIYRGKLVDSKIAEMIGEIQSPHLLSIATAWNGVVARNEKEDFIAIQRAWLDAAEQTIEQWLDQQSQGRNEIRSSLVRVSEVMNSQSVRIAQALSALRDSPNQIRFSRGNGTELRR